MEQDTQFELGTAVGRSQAFAVIANKCSAAQAESMHRIHESQTYKSTGLSWEDFCIQHFGLSRRRVDEIIQRLEEFGTTYFQLCDLVRISPEDYRRLAPSVAGETLDIGGESIPIAPENAARIRQAVATLKSGPVQPNLRSLLRRTDSWIADAAALHGDSGVRDLIASTLQKLTALERAPAA